MKKLLALLLAAAMLFSLAACGGGDDEPATDANGETVEAVKTEENKKTKAEENEIEGKTWTDFYTAFTDGESKGYDALSDKLSESEDIASLSLSFSLIKMMWGDMTLAMTSSFLSGNEAAVKTTFRLLSSSESDIDYEEKGDTALLNFKDSEGVEEKYTLIYDRKSKTGELTYEKGEEKSVISICVEDDYVAKTYYNSADSSYLEMVSYTNGDVSFAWRTADKAPSTTLLKNASLAKKNGFAKDMENYISFIGGELDSKTASSDSAF